MSAPPAASATQAGFLWSTAGFVGTKVVGFAGTVVLARLVAPEEFGVLAAIIAFIAFIELASDLGVGAALVYEQEEGITARTQTAFTVNVVAAVLLTVVGVLLAPAMASLLRAGEHADLFRLAALSLLFTGLGNVQNALLLRDMEFRRRVAADLSRTVVRTVVSIPLAAVGLGALGLVIGLLAGTAAWLVLQWTLTRFRPTFELDRTVARSLLGYGGTSSVLEVLAVVNGRADVVVIARVLGESALGLYTIAFRLPEMLINSVAWNLSIVAFPALSRQREQDERGMAPMALGLLRWQSLYAVPMATGLAVLAPSIIVAVFGTAWRDAAGVLAAVGVMTAVDAIAFPLGDVFKATNRQRILVWLNVVGVPGLILAVVLAAPAGIVTVAWVRAGAQAAFSLAIVACAARLLDVSMRQVAAAQRPGLAAAAGVAAGAVPAQLLLGDLPWAATLVGGILGIAGAVLFLRVLAPAAFAEVRELVAGLAARRRAAAGPA